MVVPRTREKANITMRKFSILGLAVFAVIAGSAIAASSAFAATSQWLAAGAVIATAKAADTSSVGTLLLQDMNASLGADVDCTSVTSTGTIGPGAADTVSAVAFTLADCTVEAGSVCEKLIEVKAANLPWVTTLSLSGSTFIDTISAGSSGKSPGYAIECKTLLGNVTDTCTKTTATTELTNVTGGVDAKFNETEEGNCTVGGEKEALISGTVLNLLTSGEALTVSEA